MEKFYNIAVVEDDGKWIKTLREFFAVFSKSIPEARRESICPGMRNRKNAQKQVFVFVI